MIKLKALVGTVLSTETVEIERSMVSRFVDALGLQDPLHHDEKSAKSAGLSGLMLPEAAVGSLGDYDSVINAVDVKPKQVLHSQEKLAIFEPLCVGDTLKITTSIHNLFEQQSAGNPMGFVTVEVVGEKGRQVVFQTQRVLAIRGGFPRR
jgi:acyl dehydratase